MEGNISEIRLFGPVWSPRNWFSCSGQLLSIAQYTAFFSLIGTLYGGDGRTSFGLPDLRGRVAVGAGLGPALTPRTNGQSGGLEGVTLNTLEIPAHNHSAQTSTPTVSSSSITINASNADNSSKDPQNNFPGGGTGFSSAPDQYATSSNVTMNPAAASVSNLTFNSINTTIGLTGGNQSHQNMQPWLSVLYIICYQGIFPSRN